VDLKQNRKSNLSDASIPCCSHLQPQCFPMCTKRESLVWTADKNKKKSSIWTRTRPYTKHSCAWSGKKTTLKKQSRKFSVAHRCIGARKYFFPIIRWKKYSLIFFKQTKMELKFIQICKAKNPVMWPHWACADCWCSNLW
jgi:hypothetical protein